MEDCIIKTLTYFDIFDYPLTTSEIKKYLCCKIEVTDDEFYEILSSISVIQESSGFYYLLGRSKIAEMRTERNEVSIQKNAKARLISKLLSKIPTIDYIGISGSLSMNNAVLSDDIDLFFITRKNSLWITRLAVDSLLFLLNQKRKRNSPIIKDKICPNMFIVTDKLAFSSKRKSLYTAHEILHLNTLFDRFDTHSKLISKNSWIKEFFPNILFPLSSKVKHRKGRKIIDIVLMPFEKISYLFQKMYMKRHKKIETITKGKAFFHPIDRQKIILEMYELRIKRYEKLYNDNIWVDRDEARFYMEEKKIRILN